MRTRVAQALPRVSLAKVLDQSRSIVALQCVAPTLHDTLACHKSEELSVAIDNRQRFNICMRERIDRVLQRIRAAKRLHALCEEIADAQHLQRRAMDECLLEISRIHDSREHTFRSDADKILATATC